MKTKLYTNIALTPLMIALFLVAGCERIPTQVITTAPVDKVAVASISEIDGSGITGTATFTAVADGVHVVIDVQNAAPGLHAMHLHIGTCADIGPHWHPMEIPAGTPGIPVVQATLDTPPIGIGEIGNISVDADGTGTLEFTTPLWSLGGDSNTDILGKLIMIHETGDTFLTNPHHAHTMKTETMEMDMETVQPHDHAPGTPPHAHADPVAAVPPVQPGGGARIGCGVIGLME